MDQRKCPECGVVINDENLEMCPNCGYPISKDSNTTNNVMSNAGSYSSNGNYTSSGVMASHKKIGIKGGSAVSKALFALAVIMYIVCAVMLYKGHDKMTNYYSSDTYYSLNQNAYVGGDAYNYIINGTYATGFFVLAVGFMVTGTILLVSGIYFNANNAENIVIQGIEKDELPDI